MSPPPPPEPVFFKAANRTRIVGCALVAACCAGGQIGCGPAGGPGPVLRGEARTVTGEDPSRSAFHGWGAIDRAVDAGAIEHEVVASPTGSVGQRFRTYRLLGPRGQPGELTVERTDDGLSLTIRLGRFGSPELEDTVLAEIRRRLAEDA